MGSITIIYPSNSFPISSQFPLMETQVIRHGDVLLTRIDSIPESETIDHKGEYVLALGEITGHAHRLRVKEPEQLKVTKSKEGVVYLTLMEVGTLTHEEHKTLEIPPGKWEMTFEREWSYIDNDFRKVID